jgi:hypothetical protein
LLGLSVLTKANLVLFVPFALGWIAVSARGAAGRRLINVCWAALGIVLVLGPWLVRTWRITGAPVIYSNVGFSLWTSNHRLTFYYFPERSIDDAGESEFEDLTADEKSELLATGDAQGIRESRWYWDKGMVFIRSHPALTLWRALYKIWIAFSPRFSPAKGWLFQVIYCVFYFPLFVLSGIGFWQARQQWRETGYMALLVIAFELGSAVFWAHTSHRMYVEPYLMILSAYAVTEQVRRGRFTISAGGS